MRPGIFGQKLPIIPWLRVKEYKLISLKMIVSSMLIHQQNFKKRRPAITSRGPAILSDEPEGNGEAEGSGEAEGNGEAGVNGEAEGDGEGECDGLEVRQCRRSVMGDALDQKQARIPGLSTLGSDLFVPGEVMRQQISFATKTTFIVSGENPGAGALAREMLVRYPDLRSEPPGVFVNKQGSKRGSLSDIYSSWSHGKKTDGSSKKLLIKELAAAVEHKSSKALAAIPRPRRRRERERGREPERRRIFLLYLNDKTWLGEEGNTLAEQVRAARAAGIKVILAHEIDPALGGCEFGLFFQTTPGDLIGEGLYASIAVAMHSGQHRAVSFCLVAKDAGAVRLRFKELFKRRVEAVKERCSAGVRSSVRSSCSQSKRKSSLRTSSKCASTSGGGDDAGDDAGDVGHSSSGLSRRIPSSPAEGAAAPGLAPVRAQIGTEHALAASQCSPPPMQKVSQTSKVRACPPPRAPPHCAIPCASCTHPHPPTHRTVFPPSNRRTSCCGGRSQQ